MYAVLSCVNPILSCKNPNLSFILLKITLQYCICTYSICCYIEIHVKIVKCFLIIILKECKYNTCPFILHKPNQTFLLFLAYYNLQVVVRHSFLSSFLSLQLCSKPKTFKQYFPVQSTQS